MATELSFFIPVGAQHRAERIAFACKNELGIEITAFIGGQALNDVEARAQLESEIEAELSGLPLSKTMHGAFIDLALHSEDRRIAALSQSRIEADILTALKIGCEKIVFHLGFNPMVRVGRYRKEFLRAHAEFWHYALASYPGISLCLENQWEEDWGIFSELFDLVQDDRFGMCLDVAHAHAHSHFSPDAWMRGMSASVLHMHWNDNRGDRDSHQAIGVGTIDWPAVIAGCGAWKEMSVTLEMRELSTIEKSLCFLARQGVPIRQKRALSEDDLSALPAGEGLS